MGLVAAPLYAFLLRRANQQKEAEIAHQASLPDHEKRVYTVQELHDLGDLLVVFWPLFAKKKG